MNKLPLLLLTMLTVGCAPSVHKINLDSSAINNIPLSITVTDKRLDKKIYITGISYAGTHIYMYDVNPKINTVIEGQIKSSMSKSSLIPKINIDINIKDLDIKNVVGFGAEDELTCIIESRITLNNSQTYKVVETLSVNNENMSPLITTVGKLILDQCLLDHSNDISAIINTQLTSRSNGTREKESLAP